MQRMTDVCATGIDLGRRAAHEAVLRAPGGTDRRLRFTHSRAGIDGFVGELAELDGRVVGRHRADSDEMASARGDALR